MKHQESFIIWAMFQLQILGSINVSMQTLQLMGAFQDKVTYM